VRIKHFLYCALIIVLCIGPYLVWAGSYNRSDYQHWVDVDKDCQNTRAEILIRDSKIPVTFDKKSKCVVVEGKWVCPYTGSVFLSASEIDIDHIVPLGNAHKSGAEFWTKEQRRAFANDPENLISVEDNANQAKGDKSPEEWQPKNKKYWKEYAKRWFRIKDKYHLKYTPGEVSQLFIMFNEY